MNRPQLIDRYLEKTTDCLLRFLGSSFPSRFSSNSDDEKKSTTAETEEKLTPVVLAQRIFSKSNLERILDSLTQRPAFVAVGCDFLESTLDLLSRQMSAPACISLASKEPTSSSNKDEPMQVKGEKRTATVRSTDMCLDQRRRRRFLTGV